MARYLGIIIKVLSEKSLRMRYSVLAEERAGYFSVERIMKEWEEVLRGD